MNLECVRGAKDGRSTRPTIREAERLREQNKALLAAVAQIHAASRKDPDSSLSKTVQEILAGPEEPGKVAKIGKRIPVSIDASNGGEFSVYGPTSAFAHLVDLTPCPAPTDAFDLGLMNQSQLVVCLSNFFKWLYPDVTVFIHRESFLNAFFLPDGKQGYCSEELVYAIAALGAKSCDSDALRDLAPSYFETARDKILSKKICIPQINTLQALLCLSLYELGDGNTSASWMYSGMAIRMGYDLGFHLNPKDWAMEDNSTGVSKNSVITNLDVMIRSRIYWGCYIADHFISLIMGRPVTVRKTEASIPSSDNLPVSKNIDEFVFQPPPSALSVKNLDAYHTVEPLCSLSEMIGALLTDIYSSESDDIYSYLTKAKLKTHNTSLADWRKNLPGPLKWTKLSLEKHDFNPTITNYKFFYYIVLICLNRPFLNQESGMDDSTSPSEVCDRAIVELSILLRKFNESGLPLSILIVYSAILAISVVFSQIQDRTRDNTVNMNTVAMLKVFYATVSNACSHWKLAVKSLVFIKKKVSEIDIPFVSGIFHTMDAFCHSNLTQNDVELMLEFEDDLEAWANQDNLFTNFFDFLEH